MDAAWIRLSGELDLATTPELSDALEEAQRVAHLVVLDLRDLDFIDVSAVRVIVGATVAARRGGRGLLLVAPADDLEFLYLDAEEKAARALLPLSPRIVRGS